MSSAEATPQGTRGVGRQDRPTLPSSLGAGADRGSLLHRTADVFRLLAACFYVPDQGAFLEAGLCGNLAALTGEVFPEARPAAVEMARALESASEEELLVDHAGLFLGPFELLAPPYGSVYLEQTKRLMGDSTMAVKAAYRDNGLEVVERDAPDHIAIELEFLHYLWSLAAHAAAQGREEDSARALSEASRFLDSFLVPWVPEFCSKIRAGAQTVFYRRLAECLERVVEHAATRFTS